jgi:hypothetical protein
MGSGTEMLVETAEAGMDLGRAGSGSLGSSGRSRKASARSNGMGNIVKVTGDLSACEPR